MARSSGCLLLAALAAASCLTACRPKQGATPAGPGGPGAESEESRADIELELRGRLARVGDACEKEAWLKELVPKTRGLQAEIAEELLIEETGDCRRLKRAAAPAGEGAAAVASGEPTAPVTAGTPDAAPASGGTGTPEAAPPAGAKPDDKAAPPAAAKPDDKAAPPAAAKPDDKAAPPAGPPEPVAGACTRKRAEADLRAKAGARAPTRGQIDTELQRCFRDRLAACQLALDADVDEGLACWREAPWPEVPASVEPAEIAKTGTCLVELKAVIADLRGCRTKKPAARDACVTPYIGYTPQCGLLKAERVWRMFPGREDVERAAKADAERASAKDAKAAKEQAEREAKEAKQKAEQDAKAAKEQTEREAKEAKQKAEQDAKAAKEQAEREAKEAKQKAEQDAKAAKEAEQKVEPAPQPNQPNQPTQPNQPNQPKK